MKIYKISHTFRVAPSAFAVPDPDLFAREVLSKLRDLKEDAEVGPFQLADHERAGALFYKVSDHVLLFSEQVLHSEAGVELCASGNVHPTKLLDSGEEIFFLNVTTIYNCLNAQESGFRTLDGKAEVGVDSRMGVVNHVFFPKLIGDSSIFKIPQSSRTLYAVSCGAGDDFYTRYHEAGLTGLTFEEVWSDE